MSNKDVALTLWEYFWGLVYECRDIYAQYKEKAKKIAVEDSLLPDITQTTRDMEYLEGLLYEKRLLLMRISHDLRLILITSGDIPDGVGEHLASRLPINFDGHQYDLIK